MWVIVANFEGDNKENVVWKEWKGAKMDVEVTSGINPTSFFG